MSVSESEHNEEEGPENNTMHERKGPYINYMMYIVRKNGNREQLFRCEVCNFETSVVGQMRWHAMQEKDIEECIRLIKCRDCRQLFENKEAKDEHIRTAHSKNSKTIFPSIEVSTIDGGSEDSENQELVVAKTNE